MTQCYCGSEMKFSQCCQPFLSGVYKPKTAEQLMRSRYSAYVRNDSSYLFKTALNKTISDTPDNCPRVTWDHLEICNIVAGLESDQTGQVEFKAFFYGQDNKLQYLWEESQFIKQGNDWLYSEGIILN